MTEMTMVRKFLVKDVRSGEYYYGKERGNGFEFARLSDVLTPPLYSSYTHVERVIEKYFEENPISNRLLAVEGVFVRGE